MDEPWGRRRPAVGRAMHIAEVAALAGVSIATVSRALANPGRVNAKTREHVLEVVRRTGYTPNVAGRSLRAARSMMVLVVVPTFITPFFSELLLGVDQALSARGYGLLIGNLHDNAQKEQRLVDLVLSGQADGVLLLNGRILQGATHSLADANVPIVAVSMPPTGGRAGGPGAGTRGCGRRGHASAGVGPSPVRLCQRPRGNHIELERWTGFTRAWRRRAYRRRRSCATTVTFMSPAASRPAAAFWR